MSKIENVSRRTFLRNVGVSSGALVLGMQVMPKNTLAMGWEQQESNNVFEPNVYLQISPTGQISVVVHRSEMGQGIRTSIPMIVADELEAKWQDINVVQGKADRKYGSQNTDGSRSVRKFFQTLSIAGASARLMLEQAAALQWNVAVNRVKASNSRVKHLDSNRSIPYGELIEKASTLPVPDAKSVTLKQPNQRRYIGKKDIALVDGKDIVTGNAVFSMDITRPGMKYAVIERPPVLGAKLADIDDSMARKVKGVIDVVTLDSVVEPVAYKALGGVAVIADSTWAAMQGRKALKINWQDNQHSNFNSRTYKESLKESCINADTILRKKGDVKGALAKSKNTHSADYFVPCLAHAPMEVPSATAEYVGGKLKIWAGTQTPQAAQGTAAQATGLSPEDVEVNVTLLGGGFGRKSKADFVAEAAILATKFKFPVQVLWTREDDIKLSYYHAVSYQTLTAALDDNRVTAWQHKAAIPPIGSTFGPAEVISSESNLGMIDMPFDIENIECAAGKAKAHQRIGWLRSVTNINNAFAVSSFADELAHKTNQDSLAYLLTLIGDDRHIDLSKENAKYGNYGEDIKDFPIDTARLKNVLKQVAADANWSKPRGKDRALGIAVHRSFASFVGCVVEVSKNNAGKVAIDNIWLSIDCGTAVNPERIEAQMQGAAIFGISIAKYGNITSDKGQVIQSNFHDYQVARITDTPPIHVSIVESDARPGGVGEPGVPPVAPAICNAIYKLTGKRHRELPLQQFGIFA